MYVKGGVALDGKVRYKRNHRLVATMQQLVQRPNQLLNLSHFTQQFDCAKSTVSEDLEIIRRVIEDQEMGFLETLTGKTGGVIFRPKLSPDQVQNLQNKITSRLQEGKRILPGNYIFVNDLLQDPSILNPIAQLIANKYVDLEIDRIVTIEAKGIGLAAAVSVYLNIPYVVARRESTAAEGSTISVNYTSGSQQIVKKMELTKSALKAESRVLIVDDFLRNGGTLMGLVDLIQEFDSQVAGVCVFAENKLKSRMQIPHYHALFETQLRYNADKEHYQLAIEAGNFFDK